MKLQVVAFDVDGTLYPNGIMYLRSLPFGLIHFRELIAFAQVRKVIRNIKPMDNFFRRQAELFAYKLNLSIEEAEERIQTVFYTEWEAVVRSIKPYPYVRETLVQLKEAGYKLAVLSDFPIGNKLKYLGLDSFWDAEYSCEEIGYLKPNPEPFHQLAAHFSVQPHEILYVGNNYRYDIEGAKRVGFRTAYLHKFPVRCPAADFRFSDYRDFIKWTEMVQ
ncbi:MAG TPA: HAD family hydrolase [Spirochaetales bacterium]|nr:HAD family hydrolase [Spirochaetales bacterium]